MHIAIDVREACRERRTGKGQWTRGFVEEMLRRPLPLLLITDCAVPERWRRADVRILRFPAGALWHIRVAVSLRRLRAEIAVYMSPTSFLVPALLRRTLPCVVVIHDLIAFGSDPHAWRARWIERCTLGRVLRTARMLCTISAATARAVAAQFPWIAPERIHVLSSGPSPFLSQVHECRIASGFTRRIILCIGTLCPRKNQRRLIEAFALLPDAVRTSCTLILAGGRGWADSTILHSIERTEGVRWMENPADAEIAHLLQMCSILAMPSLNEGFGLPVLDALHCGIPVLAARRDSLPEVAGHCAVYCDPENSKSIADGLYNLLTNEPLRAQLIRCGREQATAFTWEHVVDCFLCALRHEGLYSPS